MTAPTCFRVLTYRKLRRDEAGLTRRESRRLNMGEALDWIIAELPEDAIEIRNDLKDDRDKVTITIDWKKVPDEIRAGADRWGARR